jgi:hypothetical protein
MLEGGPVSATNMCTAAEARGINRKRLYAIAEEMKVIPERGKPGHKQRNSGWALPPVKRSKRFKDEDDEE